MASVSSSLSVRKHISHLYSNDEEHMNGALAFLPSLPILHIDKDFIVVNKPPNMYCMQRFISIHALKPSLHIFTYMKVICTWQSLLPADCYSSTY